MADRARFTDGVVGALRRPLRASQAGRFAHDAFARRYADAHGLAYEERRETPGGSLFLAGVDPERSHSFMRGPLAPGVDGMLFFVETLANVRRSLYQGWTIARVAVPAAAELATGLACGPRLTPAWAGQVVLASTLPDQLRRVRTGDVAFDERHEIGVEGPADELAVRELFDDGFRAWLDGLAWGRHGELMLRLELRRDVLCVWRRGALSSEPALDGFRGEVVHVADRVRAVCGADEAEVRGEDGS